MQLLNPNATNSGTINNFNNNNNGSSSSLCSPVPNHSASFGFGSPKGANAGASQGLSSSINFNPDAPPRVLVLTQQGGLLIVDIEGFQVRSVGYYTVKADLDTQLLHGHNATTETGWLSQTVGSKKPSFTSAVVADAGKNK